MKIVHGDGTTVENPEDLLISRRYYLVWQTVLTTGCTIWEAIEAVSSTAIEHPEWDMEEQRPRDEWDKDLGGAVSS